VILKLVSVMSPTAVVTEEEGRRELSSTVERNYLGLSDCSSVDSCDSTLPSLCDEKKVNLNLKATELRLGLPGSQSPEREMDSDFYVTKLDEKPLFPLLPAKDGLQKNVVSGNKRGFADTVDGFSQVISLINLVYIVRSTCFVLVVRLIVYNICYAGEV